MSLPWPESYWGSFTAVLAAETTGVLLFTLFIQPWITTPRARRAAWQGAFLAIGLAALLPVLSPQLRSWRTISTWRETPTVSRTIATPTPMAPAPEVIPASPAIQSTQPVDSRSPQLSAAPLNSEPIAHSNVKPQLGNTPTPAAPSPAAAPKALGEVAWLAVWAAGILLLGSRIVVAQILAWRCTRRQTPLEAGHLQPAVRELSARLGCRHPIRLLTSRQLTSPIAFGGWRPTVVVPADFSQDFTAEQQQAMLAHEVAHLAAHDPRWNLLADMVCAALWWNPLVWHARRQLSLASEQAADEASLLIADGAQTLAECLVALGARLTPARPASWLGVEGQFRSSLGQRVSRLLNLSGQTWQPTSRTALLFTKLLLPLLLTASALHSPAWATPQALTEGDPMTAFKQTWRHTFATFTLAAAIHGSTALAAEPSELTPATTNAPAPAETTLAAEPAVNTENSPNQYQMSEKMRQRYGLTGANRTNQHQMSEAMRQRYGFSSTAVRNANANSNAEETQAETEQPEPQPKYSTMSEAMRQRYGLDQAGANPRQPSSAAQSEVERKLRETTFTQLEFPTHATLGKALKYLSDQAGDLGINFIVSSSQENRAIGVDPVTGQPITPANPADIPLRIDAPLTGITLKNALEVITQLTAEPVYYTVNNFGVVFACGNMMMNDDSPAAQMSEAMMRRYEFRQQTIPAGETNAPAALAPRLRAVILPQVELKSGITLKEAAKQICAQLNASTDQLSLNVIVQAHSLAGAKIGSDVSLRQINGLDLWDIVTKVSTLPIKYVFRNNLVLIVPNLATTPNQASQPNSSATLPRAVQSRAFKLDKQRFDSRLETTFGVAVNKEMEVPARMRQAIVDLANHLGVQFREPGKEIFYNPETGMLLLRATSEGLETMAAALQTLGGDAPRAF